jgi:tripartite-type tricarboxylate transporter receptor subunit TctC
MPDSGRRILTARNLAAALSAALAVGGARRRRRATKPVVDKVNRDFNRVLENPDIRERTTGLGFRLLGGPPDKLQAMLASEIAKWAEVAKTAGMMK